MTQKTDPSPLSYVSNFYYDENDNRWKTERQTGDVMNPWQIYTATFDADDKLKTVTNPANDVTTWDYNNLRLLWKLTDAENRVTEYSYDSNSRLYTVKDPALVIAETRLYTNNGRLASIMDARSNTTQFSFDGFDRPDRTTHPNSNYEQNQVYDANGNVLTFRTRSGNTIVRTFNELNREKTRAPQGQPTVTLTYDLASRLTKASKPVVSGDPSSGDFEFFFDSAGRFFKERYPDGKVVEHQLDPNGNFIRTTWPDSYYVERAFDEINRLTGIKLNGAGSNAVTIGYDPLSRRTSMSYANGISTAYTHQLDDDLASIVHTFVGSNVTFTLGYDKVHRMTSQQVSDSQYLWHPAAAGTTTYGTANNMNQYPTVGGISYSYNGNGCLTGDGTWTWNYDTENHLTTASKTGTSITNYWDPVHRQREHKVGSTRNRYIYAGQQRIADYSNTTLQNRYVYGTGLDEVLIKVSSAGVLTYYSHDHEGSVVALSNAAGTVTNRYKYSPWGESPSMTGTTHGYTGQRFESESGLYHFKNRYYSPKLARFLQPDLGYFDGLNLYTYCDNNPLNLVDPLGLVGQAKNNAFTPSQNAKNGVNAGTTIALGGAGRVIPSISISIPGWLPWAGVGAAIGAGVGIIVSLPGAYTGPTTGSTGVAGGVSGLGSGVLMNGAPGTPGGSYGPPTPPEGLAQGPWQPINPGTPGAAGPIVQPPSGQTIVTPPPGSVAPPTVTGDFSPPIQTEFPPGYFEPSNEPFSTKPKGLPPGGPMGTSTNQ